MKVKVLHRNEEEFTKERAQDIKKVHRSYDPNLHQFQRAHEYTRALNAAKLERVFAKPFLAAFPHSDGITCLARNPSSLNSVISGTADGDIRIWDIPAKRTLRRLVGHTGAIRGVSFAPGGEACVSASTDCSVRLWKVPYAPFEAGEVAAEEAAVLEFQGKHPFRGIDHHWRQQLFATAGAVVEVWDHARSQPINTFSWGADAVLSVKFNPVSTAAWVKGGADCTPSSSRVHPESAWKEPVQSAVTCPILFASSPCGTTAAAALASSALQLPLLHLTDPLPSTHPSTHQAESDVFATTGGDRSIALYDLRSATPIRKLVMQRRSNTLAWNPMEAFNFTAANEDCNLYTYDMRKLDTATCVHQVRPREGGSGADVSCAV